MKNVIDLIKKFFEGVGWKYKCEEVSDSQTIITADINMNDALGHLRIYILVRQDYYIVYAVLNSQVEEAYRPQVAEYLHRANYGMRNGNFEFDFDDGEVRYKTYAKFADAQPSNEVIVESVLAPIFMFDRYGKNLLRIMLGETDPKKMIEEAESDIADSEED